MHQITGLLFVLLTMACIFLVFKGLVKGMAGFEKQTKSKIKIGFIAGIVLWVLALTLLAITGVLADFSTFPPKMIIVLVPPLIIVISLCFSRKFSALLANIPASWFIYIQTFRVAVEVLLWMLFIARLLPIQMTFEGRNWDIFVGLSAPVIGFFAFSKGQIKRNLIIAWNILGLLILLNIVVIAILSMPTPLQYFTNEPANTIIAKFPYVLLPGILVPIAYAMHLFSLKQLINLPKNQR